MKYIKKLPYGISNYEELIGENYYYIDKTQYIEQLEKLPEKRVMILRPRKFGKTLFTSALEYYYDINSTDKFEKLFGNTYIGKNPTKLKNSYHILRFNFSGIDTSTEQATVEGFKNSIRVSITEFVHRYGINFYVNNEQSAEDMLNSLFEAFKYQKDGEKIYAIIDEYDHFANELLGFSPDNFKKLVSRNGKVRKWYEILKKGTESVVDRIFITGVAPITLDSLTSGFNIGADKTRDDRFNEMLGFTNAEILKLMENQEIQKEEQENLLPVMKENYDGYKFSIDAEENMYNSNMCLYFLNEYMIKRKLPRNLIDVNIASDYSKLARMLSLCENESKISILEKSISNEDITIEITEQFNPEKAFGETEFVSMLFYLGYLTIIDSEGGYANLGIPNRVMRELYAKYFLDVLAQELRFESSINYAEIWKDLANQGEINKIVEITHTYLNNLSNRDYIKFDEKYVKLIFFCIVMNLKDYQIISEPEVNREYPDLLMVPRDRTQNYNAVMIEFKYLKSNEEYRLQEMKNEARLQLERYSSYDNIKDIQNLHKYTVVAVNDVLNIEEIE